jgi:hypothetical protein
MPIELTLTVMAPCKAMPAENSAEQQEDADELDGTDARHHNQL